MCKDIACQRSHPSCNVYKQGAHINGFLLRDVAAYVGPHPDGLVEDFFLIQSGRFRFGFMAMILPIVWCMWRRIWVCALLQFVALIAMNCLFGIWVGLLFASTIGALYAKRLYARQIAHTLVRLGAKDRKDEACPELDCALQKAGAPRVYGAVLGVLLLLLGAWQILFMIAYLIGR